MRKAVLYLRRSTDMQEQSIGDQRMAPGDYVKLVPGDPHSILT